MSDKMTDYCVIFPRRLLRKFIALYKDQPCLWDRNCVAYKQKQKRHEAISKLTKLVQEYDPSATRVHVLRKIESLRSCVRREYRRVRASRRTATDPSEVYTPMLWYYDLFSSVFDNNTDDNNYKVKPASPADGQNENSEDGDHDNSDEQDPPYENMIETYPVEYRVANIVDVPQDAQNKRYQVSNFEDDNKSNKRLCTEIEDEYDAIGINVAAKLRNLPPNMRIMAEKLINDVLYQAQMNGLNSSSVINTTDPFKHVII